MKKVSRTAKRIFRPLIGATAPVRLATKGVDPMDAYDAIKEAGDLVRCTDAPNPLEAEYVFTSGASARSFMTTWDRIRRYFERIME